MWPFSGAKTDEKLSMTVRALMERQEKIERVMRDIRLEWDEMYDKFRLLYARAAKRIRDAQALEPPEEPAQDAPGSTIHMRPSSQLGGNGPRLPKRNY